MDNELTFNEIVMIRHLCLNRIKEIDTKMKDGTYEHVEFTANLIKGECESILKKVKYS